MRNFGQNYFVSLAFVPVLFAAGCGFLLMPAFLITIVSAFTRRKTLFWDYSPVVAATFTLIGVYNSISYILHSP
jgi:Trk-type K+ transport system membrane component